MVTVGSVTREAAAARFPFLATNVSGRRRRIKELTHRDPDFVFWVYPDGRLHDARRSHRDNVPRGYEYILEDEPDYGGFLRGRVASQSGDQLIVVYCRPETLATPGPKLDQLLAGLSRLPVPLQSRALVISDNGDLYGRMLDLFERAQKHAEQGTAASRPAGQVGCAGFDVSPAPPAAELGARRKKAAVA